MLQLYGLALPRPDPVGVDGLFQTGQGGSPGGGLTGHRGQQEPGVVVDELHDPARRPGREGDLGGVDLPQVVGDLAFKPAGGAPGLGGRGATRWFRRRAWCTVETAGGWEPRPVELVVDPPGPPPEVIFAQAADLELQFRSDPSG